MDESSRTDTPDMVEKRTLGRRDLFRAGVGTAMVAGGLTATSGTAVAAYDGWFDDVPNYEGTYDYRGEEEVHVDVGAGEDGLLFEPAAILVDPGTTVVWEWTGEGGAHNVVEENGAFESELTEEAGHAFEHSFEEDDEDGIFRYVCTPHEALGMKGAVAVGDVDDELISPEAEAPGRQPLTASDIAIAAASVFLAFFMVVAAFWRTIRGDGRTQTS